jgi:hypothetical protein
VWAFPCRVRHRHLEARRHGLAGVTCLPAQFRPKDTGTLAPSVQRSSAIRTSPREESAAQVRVVPAKSLTWDARMSQLASIPLHHSLHLASSRLLVPRPVNHGRPGTLWLVTCSARPVLVRYTSLFRGPQRTSREDTLVHVAHTQQHSTEAVVSRM